MMARGDKTPAPREAARLYLITPPVADPATLADELAAALQATDVAAVLLRLADGDERALIGRVKALAPIVQGAGAALLIEGHAEIVARTGADGAHLAGIEDFADAQPALKPQRIAGCGGLQSRDDAMTVAESGADYVMFGEPDESGDRPAFDAIEDRVSWWAEVFQVPCVAYAASIDEAEALARAGAEFIALGDFVWTETGGAAATVAAAAQRIAVVEPVS